MAGNQKQKRKKKKNPISGPTQTKETKRKMNVSQIIFIALGVFIILSMVISLVVSF